MWQWILDTWRRLRAKRHARQEVSPENLRVLAKEIQEIAVLSGRVWARDQGMQERVGKICREMEQLNELLNRPSFKRLPEDKKRELLSSLQVSKKELLKGLQSAPCPTDKIQ